MRTIATIIALGAIATGVSVATAKMLNQPAQDKGLVFADKLPMGFEEVEAGKLPKKWAVSTPAWTARVVSGNAAEGKKFLRMELDGQPQSHFGNYMTALKADDLRGKTIELSASVRAASNGARCQMWFRVDRANGETGGFDNMQDRPVYDRSWKKVAIKMTVDSDAKDVMFGFISVGEGTIEVDDIRLRVLKN